MKKTESIAQLPIIKKSSTEFDVTTKKTIEIEQTETYTVKNIEQKIANIQKGIDATEQDLTEKTTQMQNIINNLKNQKSFFEAKLAEAQAAGVIPE